MKRKMVSFLTIFAIITAMLLPALSVSAQSVTVTADKAAYTICEQMKITVKGVTTDMEDMGAFVSITKQKSRPDDYGTWKNALDLHETDGVWTVNAPIDPGNYEIRFYNYDGDYDTSLSVRVPITVSYVTDQKLEIKTDKALYTPKEEMKVTVSGYTRAMEEVSAFVSYTKKNARPEDYGTWKHVVDLYETDGVWTVNAPADVGDYELRFYAADRDYENTLALSVPLGITYSTIQTTVIPDRTTILPDDTLKITVAGVTEAQKQSGAFVSITKKNARPEDYGSWEHIINLDQTLGVWSTKAPYEIGEYEIRLYAKDGDYTEGSIIASAPLYVSNDAAPSQSGGTPVEGSVSQGQNGVSDWAIPEINNAIGDGLVTDKVTVDFQRAITREEFCELAIKLYEAMTGKTAGAAPAGTFADTNNEQILKAYNLGIVAGVGEGLFSPGNQVSRQEIATMLLRTVRIALPAIDTSVAAPPQFIDSHEIDNWALEGVNYFASKEIIKGAEGAFLPQANCTCEAGIALVKRVFDVFSQI